MPLRTILSAVINLLTGAREERGQALAEYGLIMALIVVICIVAVGLIGTGILDWLSLVSGALGGGS